MMELSGGWAVPFQGYWTSDKRQDHSPNLFLLILRHASYNPGWMDMGASGTGVDHPCCVRWIFITTFACVFTFTAFFKNDYRAK